MKKLSSLISEEMAIAFEKAGFDSKYGKVTLSNRPDLCEYQCNGAMAAAKEYHKAPFEIADMVKEQADNSPVFQSVDSVKPGFLNLILNKEYLASYVSGMKQEKSFGFEPVEPERTIVIDYGGPNIAKPLHVGHLRSAIIGESIKRIQRFAGHHVLGDVHLGDWGLQLGLIITELKVRKPELVYFDSDYQGAYPEEAPFTLSELEEIYPYASGKSKEDEDYKKAAMEATYEIQQGRPGYLAILNQILKVSVTDLKKNYANLNVDFDIWKGESDAQAFIPDMVEEFKEKGYAHESEGALVIDVKEDTDTKEIPPCLIQKADGASLYATTDLATIVQRMQDYHPDEILYVVDKRQEMHFTQVFRAAKKTGIVPSEVTLKFLGFGTMNGKDGKPFKTREGGVMRLEQLLMDIDEQMYKKIAENHAVEEEEGRKTAKIVALSAIKYGDLSNQASKDYIFDMDRFTSFEGNTGPYLLYTIVRMKSILTRFTKAGNQIIQEDLLPADSESEKGLMMELAKFNGVIETASLENAPHKICAYLYDLANAFNHFYHENSIMNEGNQQRQNSYIQLLILTKKVMETCIDLLGFEAPDRM